MMKQNKVMPFVPMPPKTSKTSMNARSRKYKEKKEEKPKVRIVKRVFTRMEKVNTIVQFAEIVAAIIIIL